MNFSGVKEISENIAYSCGLSENIESPNSVSMVGNILSGTFAFDDYLSYRYFDEEQGLFLNDGNIAGFMLEIIPIAIINAVV